MEKMEVELDENYKAANEACLSVAWDEKDEAVIRRKLDVRIVPVTLMLYLLCFIDRANVGNARISGLATDLGLIGFQFNWALTIFFFSYIVVEIPSNLVLKKVGARVYLPSLVIGFGLVSMCTAFVSSYEGLLACRFFLGVAEGGIIPGCAYFLSCFYKRHELLFRVGIFISGASLAGAFGGLLAAGLSSIPKWGTPALYLQTWRNIFLFEGIITILLAFMAIFLLPSNPDRCNFLDARQKHIARERISRENSTNPREKTEWKHIKRAIFNINNNLCGIGIMFVNVSVASFSLFLPTILVQLGWTALQTQLYTIPPYAVACCWSILVAWLSDRFQRRGYFVMLNCALSIIGYTLLITTSSNSIKYLAVFFAAAGCFPNGPAFISWGINNAASPTLRAVASAYIVTWSNFGAIAATWTYLPQNAPNFIPGHILCLSTQCAAFAVGVTVVLYCKWENGKRQRGERDERLNVSDDELKDLGHRHPAFIYTI